MKVGDGNKIHGHLVNLLHYSGHSAGKGKIDYVDFIFNKLRTIVLERRVPSFTTYVMALILDRLPGIA